MHKKQGIQLLRIISCSGVFMVHFGQRFNFHGILRSITDCGKYGVQMFFMLSGFLACLSWGEDSNYSNKKALKYFINRCIRILPLYYICVLYYFFTETFIWKDIPIDPKGLYWLRYIFLLNGVVGEKSYFWSNLGITWTIPIFMFFYLVFPIINKTFNSLSRAVILLILTIFVSFFTNRYAGGYMPMLASLPYFVAGIILYRANLENRNKFLLLFISIMLMGNEIMDFGQVRRFCLYFMIVFIASWDLELKNDYLTKVVNKLDEYSYTLYLAHGIIFCGVLDKLYLENHLLIKLSIAIVGTVILTVFIHKYLEVPIQHWLKERANNIL